VLKRRRSTATYQTVDASYEQSYSGEKEQSYLSLSPSLSTLRSTHNSGLIIRETFSFLR